jgi:hypothetical protein
VKQEFEVSVEELLRTLQRRGIPLASEMGAFITLEVCEQIIDRPVQVTTHHVAVSEIGEVLCGSGLAPTSEQQAVRLLLVLLADLLVCAAPGVPSMLLELVERGPSEGRFTLDRLRDDLEACLVPLNRGATRRVLARLLRETRKAGPSNRSDAQPTAADIDAQFDALLGSSAARGLAPRDAPGAATRRRGMFAEAVASRPAAQPIVLQPLAAQHFDEAAVTEPLPGGGAVAKLPGQSSTAGAGAGRVVRQDPAGSQQRGTVALADQLEPDDQFEAHDQREPQHELAPPDELEPYDRAHEPSEDEPRADSVSVRLSLSESEDPAPLRSFRVDSRRVRATGRGPDIDGLIEGSIESKRRSSAGLWAFAACLVAALGLVAAYLALGRDGARGALGLFPQPQAADGRPSPAPRPAPRPVGELHVTSEPPRAQVLLLIGPSPALATELPVGLAQEFVALAEGYAPARALVPANASWEEVDGKPRYELAIQAARATGDSAKLGLGKTLLTRDVGTPQARLGTVRVVTTPKGANVYQLIGFTPDARVENLPLDQVYEVLVYVEGHPPVTRQLVAADFKDVAGRRVAELDLALAASKAR